MSAHEVPTEYPPSASTEVAMQSFTIVLKPMKTGWRTPPVSRLRGLLKAALRQFGFRAMVVTPAKPEEKP